MTRHVGSHKEAPRLASALLEKPVVEVALVTEPNQVRCTIRQDFLTATFLQGKMVVI